MKQLKIILTCVWGLIVLSRIYRMVSDRYDLYYVLCTIALAVVTYFNYKEANCTTVAQYRKLAIHEDCWMVISGGMFILSEYESSVIGFLIMGFALFGLYLSTSKPH